jgi:hypothetical protein
MHVIFTIGGAVVVWAVVLGILFFMRNVPRAVFVVAHYVVTVFGFGVLAYVLRKSGAGFTPMAFTIMIVGVFLILELFYWVFVNPAGAGRHLTVVDWLIPAGLVFGAVYIIALYSQ